MKIRLECEFDSIDEMNEFMVGVKPTMSVSTSITTDEDKPKEIKKSKTKAKLKKGDARSIKEYTKFKMYRKPRTYNRQTKIWSIVGKKGGGIFLPFEDLIKVIEDYRADVPLKETRKKITPSYDSDFGVSNLQYIWRAGGFNEGIYENARRYNYRPEELISKEGD